MLCRLLYYADWGVDARVVRCQLDGTACTVLLGDGRLQNPNCLTLSTSGSSQRLYVVDAQLKHRQSSSDPLHTGGTTSALFTLSFNDNEDANYSTTALSHVNVLSLISAPKLTRTFVMLLCYRPHCAPCPSDCPFVRPSVCTGS